jgi:hypothetical protein
VDCSKSEGRYSLSSYIVRENQHASEIDNVCSSREPVVGRTSVNIIKVALRSCSRDCVEKMIVVLSIEIADLRCTGTDKISDQVY